MRKLTALILAITILAGCGRALTNDEIIAETQKCEAAGLRAVVQYNGMTMNARKVTCLPEPRP